VTWPSGAIQEWTDLPVKLLVHLTEGTPAFTTEAIRAWPAESRPRVDPAFSWDLTGEAVEGSARPLAVRGRPAVVNFWGVTCAPCKVELPALAALAARFADSTQFTGVSVENDDPAAVRAAIAGFGLGYPQVVANERILKSFFGEGGGAILPSTFVFDGEGNLRRVFRRAVTEPELAVLLDSFEGERTSALHLEVLANEFWKRRMLADALVAIEKSLAIQPRAVAHHAHGLYLASSGKTEEAIAAYYRSLEMDPGYLDVQYNLAVALHSSGKAAESLPHYRRAAEIKKEDGEFLLLWGSASAESREFDQARDLLSRAIIALPSNPRAMNAMGKFQMMTGQKAEARRFFEGAIALDPEYGEPRKWLRELDQRENR